MRSQVWVSLATTRRWAPAVFLLLAVVGQTVIFLAVSNVLRRMRPTAVDRIPEDLPANSWAEVPPLRPRSGWRSRLVDEVGVVGGC